MSAAVRMNLGRETVLLVEADRALREWCRQHLSVQGLTVMAFADAQRALDAAYRQRPDLLIVGSDLPHGQAIALATRLRAYDSATRTRILLLAPETGTLALAQVGSIRPDGILKKPFTPHELIVAVAAQLFAEPPRAHEAREEPTDSSRLAGYSDVASAGRDAVVEARQATVLAVAVGKWSSEPIAFPAEARNALVDGFVSVARAAVHAHRGHVVRADPEHVVAFFDEVAGSRVPAARALRAALGVMTAARNVMRSVEDTIPEGPRAAFSVGCGIEAGGVTVAKVMADGKAIFGMTGPAVDAARQLAEHARDLGWAVAASERVVSAAGPNLRLGRRTSLVAGSADIPIQIAEVLGFGQRVVTLRAPERVKPPREPDPAHPIAQPPAAEHALETRDAHPAPGLESWQAAEAPRVPERRLIRQVARSRFVASYEAEHQPSGRRELVRTVSIPDAPGAFVRSYLDEYRKLADIEERNVVAILDVGQTDTLAYVACELLTGGSLAAALERGMTVASALDALAQMCMALDAVHSRGVIHGGLRAEDFLFRDERTVVLASLGVARRSVERRESAGERFGTQDSSALRSRLTPRRDLQALSAIFCAMLTGSASRAEGKAEDQAERTHANSLRLPEGLSELQPVVDRLAGVGEAPPFADGADVILELLGLRDRFPFDSAGAASEKGSRLLAGGGA